MSVYLAGVALPDPAECLPGLTPTGTQSVLADSTPDYSYAATTPFRNKWQVRWTNLTYQQYRLVCEIYKIATIQAVPWTPAQDDSASYQVMALIDVSTPRDEGAFRFSIGFTLQEV